MHGAKLRKSTSYFIEWAISIFEKVVSSQEIFLLENLRTFRFLFFFASIAVVNFIVLRPLAERQK